MLNFGIAGFRVNGSTEIGIYTDGVNMELTTFLRVLADGYLNFGRRDVQCGYGEFDLKISAQIIKKFVLMTPLG